MRGYDDNINKQDYESLKNGLENLLYRVENEDISYGEVFSKLEYMANNTIGVSYDEYIKENTLGFLEYAIEQDIEVDELGAYIGNDIYYTSICNRLWANFEYEGSNEFYEDSEYIDRTERFEASYDKIKELLYKGVSRSIYNACERLDLDYDDLSKIDMMKVANYYDASMYEKELENNSFSFSKSREQELEI